MIVLVEAQTCRIELWIESGALVEWLVIVGHHVFELCESSVVHVGLGDLDIAQAGSDEAEFVFLLAGDFEEAEVVEVFEQREAVVPKFEVAEMRTAVAFKASGSAFHARRGKENAASFLLLGKGLFFRDDAIVFGIIAGDSEEEVFQGEAQLFLRDRPGAVGFLKVLPIDLTPV